MLLPQAFADRLACGFAMTGNVARYRTEILRGLAMQPHLLRLIVGVTLAVAQPVLYDAIQQTGY